MPPPVEVPAWVHALPAVNAGLNGLATVLLVVGYRLVKNGGSDGPTPSSIRAHRNVMLSAFATSCLFLGCYLTYHFALHHYTGSGSRRFEGSTAMKVVYYPILLTHVVLAAAVPVLALMTIYRGLKNRVEAHRRIARWTFPIWLYVSITGVVIYFMLYHLG